MDNWNNILNEKNLKPNVNFAAMFVLNFECLKEYIVSQIKGFYSDHISFEGEACVISISSTNILANMLVGKTKEEGIYIIDNYLKMINEEEYDKDVLKELLAFDDTSRQPSRIKCATLSANGIKDYLEEENHS